MDYPVLGIDVSKLKLDICCIQGEKRICRTFSNNHIGFAKMFELLKSLGIEHVHACMESTGKYWEGVATALHDEGHAVSVVPPIRIKAHGRAEGQRTKTDKVDAGVIASFCQKHWTAEWSPLPAAQQELRDLERQLQVVRGMRRMEENRLESGIKSDSVIATIKQHIEFLDEQEKSLECIIKNLIKSDTELNQQAKLICSIKGLGNGSAATVLGEIGDVNRFRNCRQLDAFAGLDVTERESGSSIHGRPHISKQGNKALRTALYFPAMVAMRHNPLIIEFVRRLQTEKRPKKLIICAVMRKLLHLIFGVLKSGKPFDPNYQPIG